MRQKALTLLGHLVRDKSARGNRLTDLLKEPAAAFADGWYMVVPPFFNEALDLKQTERIQNKEKSIVWTQGSFFSFKEGDILYDTPEAYGNWAAGLKLMNLCVQVDAATSAGSPDPTAGRFSGRVAFSIFTPNKDRTQLVKLAVRTLSQDDFVKFLISGPSEEFQQDLSHQQHPQLS